jgi:hypothetical protein
MIEIPTGFALVRIRASWRGGRGMRVNRALQS